MSFTIRKKLLLPLICLLALISVTALADGPVNPYRQEVLSFFESSQRSLLLQSNAARNDFSVTTEGTFDFGQSFTWTVTPSVQGSFTYNFQMTEASEEGIVFASHGWVSDQSVTFVPVAPGDYQMRIWALDTALNQRIYLYEGNFSLAADGAHPTTEEKANEVISLMEASGAGDDWHKALFLHDWLVQNASYDNTYSYYSPQGVLVRGTGVCDSFSRAYMLLLNKAGISVKYISNANHAWNAVFLEGAWHLVDTTWDNGSSSSAFGSHMYFCVTSELLETDHPLPHTPAVACSSLACNYIVRTDVLDGLITDLSDDAGHILALPLTAFSARYSYIPADNMLWSGAAVDYALAPVAYRMNGGSWTVRGVNVSGTVSYTVGSGELRFRFTSEGTIPPRGPSGLLTLPDSLVSIGEFAYIGASSVEAVALPEGLTAIDNGAFRDTGLQAVLLPSSLNALTYGTFPADCALVFHRGASVIDDVTWTDSIYLAD